MRHKEQSTERNADKEFLRTEPLGRLLLKLALPTVAAQLINMLYNIVDRIYIGHIPEIGATALTGVGVCMPLIMIVSAFAALVGYGGAPRASIFMGKQDKESAEKTLGNCFVLQILISVVLTVVLLIWNRDFLMAFGASENTIEYGVNYMNIYALGTIFVEITLGMNAFITAQGFAKTGMLSVLIGAVANIILDPVFIFGFHMDVRGAALATIISQALSCIWVVSFLCGKKTFLKIRRKNLRLVPKIILPCLALGVATFIMQASESVISVCFNSSLQKYGGDIAVGAMTILTSVMQFAMLPLQGLGQGAQPIISYSYGAGDQDRVRAAFKLLLKVSLGYSVFLWLLVMALPGGFAAMFTSDARLMEYTRTALRIYMGSMFLFGIQMACQMTFNALGKAKESIVVAVMRKFVLLIPLIYIMPQILRSDQTMAVYMAEPIADLLAVTFTAVLFGIQFKKILGSMKKNVGEKTAK
ncbi:MAG TPA: MATE family efflux transporter [Candidatus Blautia avicola]|uniref:Multidrug export protein MepA n=1 Tax=Candidatus Blautia avicola TaxID=2838483 RepID=A0A9D2QRD2_9FIRM|nr:MATE family efflux transporter [Candidatus Blautia avicola]